MKNGNNSYRDLVVMYCSGYYRNGVRLELDLELTHNKEWN